MTLPINWSALGQGFSIGLEETKYSVFIRGSQPGRHIPLSHRFGFNLDYNVMSPQSSSITGT